MPIYLNKKTGRLFYQFDYQGHTYKKTLPDKISRKDAEKAEVRRKHELFFEMTGMTDARQIEYKDFVARYFLPFAKDNHHPSSFERDVKICKDSMKFLEGKFLRQIKPADLEAFKSHRANLKTIHGGTRKPATVLRELSVLSKVFSLAVKNEFLDLNPLSRVEKPRFDNVQNKVLSYQDEIKLFANFKSLWAADVCRFVLNTGLRQNDVLGLSKFNIDRQANSIRLVQGKTKRVVEIPLNDTARAIIESRWQKSADLLFPSPKTQGRATSVKRSMILSCQRAGIEKFTIRDLRRTFATRLAENGCESSSLAKLLGHRDLRMVEKYARQTEILRVEVDGLSNQTKLRLVS